MATPPARSAMNAKPLKTADELSDMIVEGAMTRHGRWPAGMTLFVFDDAYGWSASISRACSEADDAYRNCTLDLVSGSRDQIRPEGAAPVGPGVLRRVARRSIGGDAPGCCRCDTTGKTLNFCPAPLRKIFLFPKHGTYGLTKPSRARYRGRIAIVTTRGAGCGGRERRAGECADRVRSSRVVLIPRRWDQANRDDRSTTGAIKPGTPRRARSKP